MKSIVLFMMMTAMMNSGQISKLLTAQANRNATPQTLWTLGFELFYGQGFPQKEMAANLAKAYAAAAGKTPDQKAILKQAAAFWEKEVAHWDDPNLPANAWRERVRPTRPFVHGFQGDPLSMWPAPKPSQRTPNSIR
ncbi:MAG: hypothetical protein HQK55_03245 [Deltaproteobacteria bacterium]|nr:hypothetical protein [Deltaproteobacteria bacterium]